MGKQQIVMNENPLKKAAYLFERDYIQNQDNVSLDEFSKWEKIVTNDFLNDRLESYGLNKEEFQKIISQKENPKLKNDPTWFEKFNQIMDAYEPEEMDYSTFQVLFAPFIQYIIKQIGRHMNQYTHIIDVKKVQYNLINSLYTKFFNMGFRCAILEINVARELGTLEGNTSKERFHYFMQQFDNIYKLKEDFYTTYPVLARLFVEHTESFIITVNEIADRLTKDFEEIQDIFSINANFVNEIKIDLGDTHQNGRSVAIIQFENNQKLVYKPRSLSIDKSFENITKWINSRGIRYMLKSAEILDKSTYGWQEYIELKDCRNKEEVEKFYYRQGVLTALFYVLGSTDFHAENFIVYGEYPIPVDLETLFSKNIEISTWHRMQSKFVKELNFSIFSSMMLPIPKIQGHIADYDLSAIGANGEQTSKKFQNLTLTNYESDEVKVDYVAAKTTNYKNRPIVNGEKETPLDYIKEMLDGFADTYQVFLNHLHNSEEMDQFIKLFEHVEVRQVFRPTQVYGDFLTKSFHPTYLENGMNRSEIFEYLWKIAQQIPKYKEIINFEIKDMLRNDIPYFTYKMNSRALFDSDKTHIPDFFDETGIDTLKTRINHLSKDDLTKQLKYFKWSLSTLIKDVWQSRGIKKSTQTKQIFSPPLTEAFLIGEEIKKRSIREADGSLIWLGLNIESEDGVEISIKSLDLYDGILGYALFFAHLSNESGNLEYQEMSLNILKGVENRLKDSPLNNSISVYNGEAGYIYTLAHLGVLWNDQELIDLAVSRLEKIEDLLPHNEIYDFVGGLAGMLVAFIKIYQATKRDEFLQMVLKSSQYLINYLNTPFNMGPGFSHGASGMIYCLDLLYELVPNTNYLETIVKLKDYVTNFYNSQMDNWDNDGNNRFYWCHGKPGILLSKNIDHMSKNDFEKYVIECLDFSNIQNHSMCHGMLGNIDILITLSKNSNKTLLKEMLDSCFTLLENSSKSGWVTGIHPDAEMDGIMLGLTGIGYGLLRMENQDLPSLLTLDMPKEGIKNV
ncbi:type 2 lanthipeptide synthetase LanM family protein [Ureibacillus aquaedulcis]|uniref:Type 2 lanthipeptide synthetase LanM family protein n=1 Tax=Ureibacillus aquaedulcis TaxID=3058421 RepID=A0ABT8GVX0_9BACL|nr:type 2 lanthipeptide synthetase LanM family protein [Ureibacillus sp. BA0131]MDN4495532.1 type 2 lanthipeptide synthetase LanM family protein [Ureibacillus sp. BA0131]